MNFLLIGLDQVLYETLGYNGNGIADTPNIDKLAQKGFRFRRAYTTSPLCSPARASMFTGRYAFDHGMGTNCDMYHSLSAELERPEELLHYQLLNKGYNCGYIGKWHVGTNIGPCDYGFDGQNIPGYGNCHLEKDYLQYLESNNLKYEIKNQIYYNPNQNTLAAGVWDGPEESTTQYYLANRTIELLDKYAKDDKPFFLTCQFWGPHGPHLPPASFAGKTDRSKIKQWLSYEDDLAGKPNFVRRHLEGFYRKPPKTWAEWQEIIGLCYDFTSFIDKQIGRIIDYLEVLGLESDTMIFFTADHGDIKGVHGGLIDKGFLYEEAIHIPLLLYHPEYEGDKDIEKFVYNMDVMPTMLDIAGIKIEGLHSKSIMPLLDDEKWDRECAYIEFHGLRFLYTQRAVIDQGNYKYIWTPGDFDELYDLNSDPSELVNQIDNPEYEDIKISIQSKLKRCGTEADDPVQEYIYKILGEWKNTPSKTDPKN